MISLWNPIFRVVDDNVRDWLLHSAKCNATQPGCLPQLKQRNQFDKRFIWNVVNRAKQPECILIVKSARQLNRSLSGSHARFSVLQAVYPGMFWCFIYETSVLWQNQEYQNGKTYEEKVPTCTRNAACIRTWKRTRVCIAQAVKNKTKTMTVSH